MSCANNDIPCQFKLERSSKTNYFRYTSSVTYEFHTLITQVVNKQEITCNVYWLSLATSIPDTMATPTPG